MRVVPHAPVWNYAELFAHPQTAARGMRVTVHDPQGRPVELVGTPFHIAGVEPPAATMPPKLGEHTDTVLAEWLGLDEQQRHRLRESGAHLGILPLVVA